KCEIEGRAPFTTSYAMSTRTRTVSTHARAHRPYSTASPTRPLVFTRARRLRTETAGQAAALTGADPNQREVAPPAPFTKLKQPKAGAPFTRRQQDRNRWARPSADATARLERGDS